MKIFLTGASGLVGGGFARAAAAQDYEVVGTVGNFKGTLEGVQERIALDLTSPRNIRAAIAAAAPDAIVNAAGISEPAKCDSDPELSQTLNVALPELLAQIAKERKIRFVHVSSEQVFDGTRAPYTYTDPVSPINRYGKQKLESEQRVHAAAPDLAVTLRAPLLMGNSPGGRRSLHERLLADWAAGKTSRVYADEFRQTCTGENLAAAMLELCKRREICGVFHWAGKDLLSRVELAERIRAHFGLAESGTPLVPIHRIDDPVAAAQRQANLALKLEPLSELLTTPVETFSEQLAGLRIPAALSDWVARTTA